MTEKKNGLLILFVGFSLGALIAGTSLFIWAQKGLKISPEIEEAILKKHTETIEEMKLAVQTQKTEYNEQFADVLNSIKQAADNATEEMKLAVQTQKTEYNEQFADVLNSMKQETTAETKRVFSSIEDQGNNFIEAVHGKLRAKDKNAEDSYQRGLALKSTNPEMAKVFFLNAINHQPDRLVYLQDYIMLIKEKKNRNQDDLAQARSILELFLFQASSNDVESVQSMLESINALQEQQLADVYTTDSALVMKEIEQELLNIKNASTSIYSDKAKTTDIYQLEKMTAQLSELKTNLQGTSGEEKYSDEIDALQQQVTLTLHYVARCQQIENCLISARGSLTEKKLNTANSQIQEANSLLAQQWGLDTTKLLPEHPNWATSYSNEIAGLEEDFNKTKSSEALAKINEIAQESVSDNGNLTERIKAQITKLEQINVHIQKIYDRESQLQVQDTVKQLNEKIGILKEKRIREYQNWAADRILNAMREFDDEVSVSNDDARNIFYNNKLVEIDLSLMIPEISNTYSDITKMLYSKMDKTNKRIVEYKCMTINKKSLEDF